jgi:hypothetical protein
MEDSRKIESRLVRGEGRKRRRVLEKSRSRGEINKDSKKERRGASKGWENQWRMAEKKI